MPARLLACDPSIAVVVVAGERVVPAVRSRGGDPGAVRHTSGSIAVLPHRERIWSSSAASRRSTVRPYACFTSSMRPANQHRFRSGSHSPASLPDFWLRFTCGEASVRFRRSCANFARVCRFAAQSPESCASPAAMMSSMAVVANDAQLRFVECSRHNRQSIPVISTARCRELRRSLVSHPPRSAVARPHARTRPRPRPARHRGSRRRRSERSLP